MFSIEIMCYVGNSFLFISLSFSSTIAVLQVIPLILVNWRFRLVSEVCKEPLYKAVPPRTWKLSFLRICMSVNNSCLVLRSSLPGFEMHTFCLRTRAEQKLFIHWGNLVKQSEKKCICRWRTNHQLFSPRSTRGTCQRVLRLEENKVS